MPTIGQVNSSAHYMARQHHSKPVTKSQKVMSKRHHVHRAQVDAMPGKTVQEKIKKAKTALRYDLGHKVEHQKSGEIQRKVLKKLIKMRVKVSKANAS